MDNFLIKTAPNKGRAMFATRDIKAGETIFEEQPFVSAQFAWNSTYKYLACDYCLKPLETAQENAARLAGDKGLALPYPDCCPTTQTLGIRTTCPHCAVQYCSENCRIDAAQRYHHALCLRNQRDDLDHPLNALVDAWKKIHYPPETTSITLICKLLGMYQQTQNRAGFLDLLKDFQDKVVNEDAMIAHKMLGPNFDQQLRDLYPLYCKAFAAGGHVADTAGNAERADMSMFLTPQAFKTFFAIIGTNGQGLGTSPFASWVKNVTDREMPEDEKAAVNTLIDDLYERLDEVTGLQFLNNEGSALYSTQSKINHSCVPNAQPTFPHSNHTLALIALSDIANGDEICISYLDECTLERSRHSRQKELKENYLFVCRCPKCDAQATSEPDETSDEDEDDDEDDDEMEG